jgi:hypothetical protein
MPQRSETEEVSSDYPAKQTSLGSGRWRNYLSFAPTQSGIDTDWAIVARLFVLLGIRQ